jgi:hypothetical protein
VRVRGREEERAERERERPQRHVHVEDPSPGQLGDQQAADDRAERRRQRRRHGQDARRADPFGRREGAEQHREPDRGHHPAADALQHPEDLELGQ